MAFAPGGKKEEARYLSKAEGQVAPMRGILCRFEAGTQFLHNAVCMFLLSNVLQEVAHDCLEGRGGKVCLR